MPLTLRDAVTTFSLHTSNDQNNETCPVFQTGNREAEVTSYVSRKTGTFLHMEECFNDIMEKEFSPKKNHQPDFSSSPSNKTDEITTSPGQFKMAAKIRLLSGRRLAHPLEKTVAESAKANAIHQLPLSTVDVRWQVPRDVTRNYTREQIQVNSLNFLPRQVTERSNSQIYI